MEFVTDLARTRARTEPPPLRGSAFFVASTVDEDAGGVLRGRVRLHWSPLSVSSEGQDGHAPDLADLFVS